MVSIRRYFSGKRQVTATEINRKYFDLNVDFWAATKNYGVAAVSAFLTGLYVLNYVGDSFRNPYTRIVTSQGLVLAFLSAFFVWAGSALMVVMWTHHISNMHANSRYGQFTWRLKSGKYVFNFHGWIRDIVKLTGEEIRVQLGEKKGELVENLAQELGVTMFMFYLNEQPFQRFTYLSKAHDEEELAKFVEGMVVAGKGWHGWFINAQVHPFDMGWISEVEVEDEVIPIMYPAGDHYEYMRQLQSAGQLGITKEVKERAEMVTLAVLVNRYRIELERKDQIIEAYQGADKNYEGDVQAGVARAMDLRTRRGRGQSLYGKKVTTSQAVAIALVTIGIVALIVYLWR